MYKTAVEQIELRIAETGWSDEYALQLLINSEPESKATIELHPQKLFYLLSSPKRYGHELGKAIFQSDIGPAYSDAVIQSQFNNKPIPMHLRVDGLELQEVRWEWIAHRVGGSWQPLAVDERLIFSRYLAAAEAFDPPPVQQLGGLSVAASPSDLGRYHVRPFPQTMESSLNEVLGRHLTGDRELLDRSTRRRPTLRNIGAALNENNFQILQIICHARPISSDICLLLEDDYGRTHPVSTDDLLRGVKGAANLPPLIVLLVHEAEQEREMIAGVRTMAWAFIKHSQVGAVLTLSPLMPGAEKFLRNFYRAVTSHAQPDRAVFEARWQLFNSSSYRDAWGAPALFMRTENVLWQAEGQQLEPEGSSFYPLSKGLMGDQVKISQIGSSSVTIGGSVIGRDTVFTGEDTAFGRAAGGQENIDAIFAQLSDELDEAGNADNEKERSFVEMQLKQLKQEAEKGEGASAAVVENGLTMLKTFMPEFGDETIDRFAASAGDLPAVFAAVAQTMQSA